MDDKIKKQAKEIMDEFMNALEKVNVELDHTSSQTEKNTREENPSKPDKEFNKRFLKNAPKTKDGEIIAEKKKW